ncbi:hypothetical protein [Runella slithyformis]|uniref:Uncharacterized protein n=1 Tax=Runella slithyformis (strain ATCC 29530 / DSM 19594 / LMG 11500 / NCIMB 11436 / LSU 4) TaxID=761193 RepID=A0A7U3ZK77_RUNSL|nr:hypothetical protein [Runella slithyformis]AEI48747.1 hypothetical protein Runsl_2336 [Runella slithyformis DSM 19594]
MDNCKMETYKGHEMIETLSELFTQTLQRKVFDRGFFSAFSTLFAATARSRIFKDAFEQSRKGGLLNRR